MTPKSWAFAICIIVIWGMNFVVIKTGVREMPPFLFADLRFILIALPAMLFVKPPKIKLSLLILYALFIYFGQFSFLFLALKSGMPAGITSLIVQSQAFFTILMSTWLGEKLRWHHITGFIIATAGMYLVATGGSTGATGITPVTLLLTLASAFCWGIGNIANKLIMRSNPSVSSVSLVVWGGAVAVLPFTLCSLLFEGKNVIIISLLHIGMPAMSALLYLVFISSFIGFVLWSYLLSRYESWRVAPLTLAVPVVGMVSATLILGEKTTSLQLAGALVVLGGLLWTIFGEQVIQHWFTDELSS